MIGGITQKHTRGRPGLDEEDNRDIQRYTSVGRWGSYETKLEWATVELKTCLRLCLGDKWPWRVRDARIEGELRREQIGHELSCLWFEFFVRPYHFGRRCEGRKMKGKTVIGAKLFELISIEFPTIENI
ncbi:hypothetical protein RND71_038158 [Anisodus tanguticus]|uniref:Uncharacterized protein n=1 Tax=Anisodus tanguticus TaxID=243964 RepID=A0AAE1R1Q8_9SOLA|nr:hypothetical protein RND71_038158 [Anisodus tanguticus]